MRALPFRVQNLRHISSTKKARMQHINPMQNKTNGPVTSVKVRAFVFGSTKSSGWNILHDVNSVEKFNFQPSIKPPSTAEVILKREMD